MLDNATELSVMNICERLHEQFKYRLGPFYRKEMLFIILKSTQNFSIREAVTVRKTTVLGDALLAFSCHGGGWFLEERNDQCGLVFFMLFLNRGPL